MKSSDQLRRRFEMLRRCAMHETSAENWMEEVRKQLPQSRKPTPSDWVEAAAKATVRCWRCSGTGTYRWGGGIAGLMLYAGPCYRCVGKGRQNQADFRADPRRGGRRTTAPERLEEESRR